MRCQLEAYKNEVEIVRSDLKLELQAKEHHVRTLEEGLKSIKEKSTCLPVQLDTTNSPNNITDERSVKLISKYRKERHDTLKLLKVFIHSFT